MWITKIILEDVRSFEKETIELSKGINLLVGPNNSGKSTIAYAALSLQQSYLGAQDVRAGKNTGNIDVYVEDGDPKYFNGQDTTKVALTIDSGRMVGTLKHGQDMGLNQIPSVEPANFIYPYLSKRKVISYSEQINAQVTNRVSGNLQDLYAKD